MESFLLAQSNKSDWPAALEDCLTQLGQIPSEAQLGFVYVTDPHATHLGEIYRSLQERTSIKHWVGTVGSAVCCTNTEYYNDPAIVLLIADIPRAQFHLFDSHDNLPAIPENFGLHVTVAHGDPRNGHIADLVARLPEQIGNGYLIGGLTSSSNYYYQIANGIAEGSLSGVIFDEGVEVLTGVTQGCSPIGHIHQLTECDSNIAISIDGRPALDVMKEEIGEVLARDLNRIGGYIFAGFPVKETDTGDYLVRNLMGIDPNSGAIAIGEYLKANSPIMFCRRDGSTAVTDMLRMLESLRKRLGDRKIKGGLYFTCLGRGEHMFGDPNREMQLISETLGEFPVAGFYANGEIAGNRLYGYTGVLTLFTK
jgi:small ligand-binding sensory domain FIST